MKAINICFDKIRVPRIVAINVWINGGSSYDPIGQKGAHQLLAALLTRGCGPYTNIGLADLVEGCGAGLRCDASEDSLLISLKCVNSDLKQLIPILGSMIADAHIEAKQLELERDLTIQALRRQNESPFYLAFDSWRDLAYKNGPYSHDPLGIEDDLKNIMRNDILTLAKNLRYSSPIFSLSGDLPNNIEKLLDEVESLINLKGNVENFDNLSVNKGPKLSLRKELKLTKDLILKYQETNQVVIIIGVPSIPHGHEDDIPLRILSCHLGSGMSSLLFRKLREENGVAYDVGTHYPIRRLAAPFLIHASTTEEKSMRTLSLLIECWKSLTEKSLTNQELELAKAKFRGQLSRGSQTSAQRSERKAQLRGLLLPDNHDEVCLDVINELNVEDIRSAAIRVLKQPLASLCGPEKTLNKLADEWSKIIS